MFRRPVLACVALTPALASASAAGAPVTIVDLAPPESMVLVGTNNWSHMQSAFDATQLRALLNEPAVQRWLGGDDGVWLKGLTGTLATVDARPEDVGFPSGMAGGAVWFGPNPDTKAFEARWLLAADYGERAKDVEKILLDLIDRWADKGRVESDETPVGEATVHVVTFKARDEEPPAPDAHGDADAGDAWDDGDGADAMRAFFGTDLAHPAKALLARVGGVLLVASDMGAMERAIDRMEGENVRSVAETPVCSGALAQLGDVHAFAVLFAHPLVDRLNAMHDAELEDHGGEHDALAAMPMKPGALADAMGLGEVGAVGLGLRFDADGAMVELVGGLLAGKKEGLLALVNGPGDAFKPPAFVGADVSAVWQFRFDFAGVVPLVQRIVASMPPDAQAQAGAYLTMVSATVSPLLAALGPEVVVTERTERPLGPQSRSTLVAVRTTNALTVSNMLTQFGPSLGVARRDFEGNEIWEAEQRGFGAMPAIGVGGGYAFLGPVTSVEGALRLVGRPDGLRLADEPRFQRAASGLGAAGLLYAYAEMKSSLEYLEWQLKNYEQLVRAQLEPLVSDMEPDARRQVMERAMETAKPPKWLADMPGADVFLRHVGDSVSEARSTPDGFRWRTRWLPAAKGE